MLLYGTKHLLCRAQARDLLARGAAEGWGLDSLPKEGRLPGGKPWFPSAPERQFNLSHSGTLALCALDHQPVGVDIQIVKETWRPALMDRVCSPAERDWLAARGDRWADFALLWAMKESRVKQSGEGLTRAIRGIAVPLPEDGETLCPLGGLWFGLYGGAGWWAAVCGLTPPPEKITWLDGAPDFS